MPADPAPKQDREQPEVAALRKKLRGEPLSDEERSLLESTYRAPPQNDVGVPHEDVMKELEERKRRSG
jgi:hypothetical protein